jgi:hypothetical protein
MSTSETDSQEQMSVRFTVFAKPDGVVLCHCPAAPFSSAVFSSESGSHYRTGEALIEALNRVGLPGAEIMNDPSNTAYTVTAAQLRELETAA